MTFAVSRLISLSSFVLGLSCDVKVSSKVSLKVRSSFFTTKFVISASTLSLCQLFFDAFFDVVF